MQLHKFVFVYVLFLVLASAVDLSDAARGRGGGSRGGGSKSSGSKSSGSKSKTSGGSKGGSGAAKITKYTPIKATSVRSPVIVTQAKQGSRSSAFTRGFVGYLVARHVLSRAPVYRQGYPMYRNYVTIPKDRAVRLSYEEEKLLNADGNLCLGNSSVSRTLREGIDEHLVELNTTIKYKKTGAVVRLQGIDNTVSLKDVKGEDFELSSNARYNTSIVEGTNCTRLEKKVEGTMVEMYDTNPDSACAVFINYKLLFACLALLGLFKV